MCVCVLLLQSCQEDYEKMSSEFEAKLDQKEQRLEVHAFQFTLFFRSTYMCVYAKSKVFHMICMCVVMCRRRSRRLRL